MAGLELLPEVGARVTLSAWLDGRWQALDPASATDGSFSAELPGGRVAFGLQRDDGGGRWDYQLRFESSLPTRIRVSLALPGGDAPFHLIPCCIHGDNNLGGAEPGHFPNLTRDYPESESCAPYWEFRADRASLPVSLLLRDSWLAAVSVQPYSDGPDGFIRNGVFAALDEGDQAAACGVTLGYRNSPVSFINKDQFGPPTTHTCRAAETSGAIYLRRAADRRAVHAVIADVYAGQRSRPEEPISRETAKRALVDALCQINWDAEKRNFTNQHTMADPERRELRPWRTLKGVGWTGGGIMGAPLLAAGLQLGHADAIAKARHALHWVTQAWKPESGLLWDNCGETEGKSLNGWWSGYLVKDVHCAYTNATGVYGLLRAVRILQDQGQAAEPAYQQVACRVLDTICDLQLDSGSFGYTYSPDEPRVLDTAGFAGVWFCAALALAHSLTGEARYLAAAARGMHYYHGFVRDLNCWGTPMDTWKSLDQEGNIGFVRAARLLHEETGEARFLEMLVDGAHYEYLWRYGFRARPECPPLQGSHWNSCGGSVTSVSNPHIHPMGLLLNTDLLYLAEVTGDPMHRQRYEDGLSWATNTVALYPDISGYGALGVVTERFCPSDGLTIETYPDGSPASIWFSYNGWAAAAFLEALI